MSEDSKEVDFDLPESLTKNCSLDVNNEYCEPVQDYVARIERHILPGAYEWSLVAFYCLVFSIGLTGNTLVMGVILRCFKMRTTANLFLTNLAIADVLVILLCLPPTLLEDLRQTWYFGVQMCKIAKFMQVLGFIFSSLEREEKPYIRHSINEQLQLNRYNFLGSTTCRDTSKNISKSKVESWVAELSEDSSEDFADGRQFLKIRQEKTRAEVSEKKPDVSISDETDDTEKLLQPYTAVRPSVRSSRDDKVSIASVKSRKKSTTSMSDSTVDQKCLPTTSTPSVPFNNSRESMFLPQESNVFQHHIFNHSFSSNTKRKEIQKQKSCTDLSNPPSKFKVYSDNLTQLHIFLAPFDPLDETSTERLPSIRCESPEAQPIILSLGDLEHQNSQTYSPCSALATSASYSRVFKSKETELIQQRTSENVGEEAEKDSVETAENSSDTSSKLESTSQNEYSGGRELQSPLSDQEDKYSDDFVSDSEVAPPEQKSSGEQNSKTRKKERIMKTEQHTNKSKKTTTKSKKTATESKSVKALKTGSNSIARRKSQDPCDKNHLIKSRSERMRGQTSVAVQTLCSEAWRSQPTRHDVPIEPPPIQVSHLFPKQKWIDPTPVLQGERSMKAIAAHRATNYLHTQFRANLTEPVHFGLGQHSSSTSEHYSGVPRHSGSTAPRDQSQYQSMLDTRLYYLGEHSNVYADALPTLDDRWGAAITTTTT